MKQPGSSDLWHDLKRPESPTIVGLGCSCFLREGGLFQAHPGSSGRCASRLAAQSGMGQIQAGPEAKILGY